MYLSGSVRLQRHLWWWNSTREKKQVILNLFFKCWDILQSDPLLQRVFDDKPVVNFKRNIRDRVLRACPSKERTSGTSTALPEVGNFKCGNCVNCRYTKNTKWSNHPVGGEQCDIRPITWKTRNDIYLMSCPWSTVYIGERRLLKAE